MVVFTGQRCKGTWTKFAVIKERLALVVEGYALS
jgi:hypothetical protein